MPYWNEDAQATTLRPAISKRVGCRERELSDHVATYSDHSIDLLAMQSEEVFIDQQITYFSIDWLTLSVSLAVPLAVVAIIYVIVSLYRNRRR